MLDHDKVTMEAARDRLSTVALGLSRLLHPVDAASSFIGAGLTLMRMAVGDEYAASYFRQLSEELEEESERKSVQQGKKCAC